MIFDSVVYPNTVEASLGNREDNVITGLSGYNGKGNGKGGKGDGSVFYTVKSISSGPGNSSMGPTSTADGDGNDKGAAGENSGRTPFAETNPGVEIKKPEVINRNFAVSAETNPSNNAKKVKGVSNEENNVGEKPNPSSHNKANDLAPPVEDATTFSSFLSSLKKLFTISVLTGLIILYS
ncbi:unnamed protein product, partial [marine sediment metagenome]